MNGRVKNLAYNLHKLKIMALRKYFFGTLGEMNRVITEDTKLTNLLDKSSELESREDYKWDIKQ